MRILGLDIGGANLKAADSEGQTITRPFAVWKEPDRLASEIDRTLECFVKPDGIAVTMTAELADCYRTKREGVDAILRAVELPAGAIPIVVWATSGQFVAPEEARATPQLVAAANWHALATFIGRRSPNGPALLIDIGTTTADLIPLIDGVPSPIGRTDRERLQSGELLYTGVRRTPLCAIVSAVPFRGDQCPLAAEWFATTLDIYLTLGALPEDPRDHETANGRSATISAARDRLARCLCCDATEFTDDDAVLMSEFIADAQRRQIAHGMAAVIGAQGLLPSRVFLAGTGTFLAKRILSEVPTLSDVEAVCLAEVFGANVSEAACAYAIARLAVEYQPFPLPHEG